MDKKLEKGLAIALLGGTPALAAVELGITRSAISQWPNELPRGIEDRVLAALARKHLPLDLMFASAKSACHLRKAA